MTRDHAAWRVRTHGAEVHTCARPWRGSGGRTPTGPRRRGVRGRGAGRGRSGLTDLVKLHHEASEAPDRLWQETPEFQLAVIVITPHVKAALDPVLSQPSGIIPSLVFSDCSSPSSFLKCRHLVTSMTPRSPGFSPPLSQSFCAGSSCVFSP